MIPAFKNSCQYMAESYSIRLSLTNSITQRMDEWKSTRPTCVSAFTRLIKALEANHLLVLRKRTIAFQKTLAKDDEECMRFCKALAEAFSTATGNVLIGEAGTTAKDLRSDILQQDANQGTYLHQPSVFISRYLLA